MSASEDFQLYFIIITSLLSLLIGCFGNIISIIIFKNKQFEKQPFSRYLICASLFNIIMLLYFPIMMLPSLWLINDLMCQVIVGLSLLTNEMHAWIVAVCSFDRLIFVLFPFKFHFKNKLTFQLGIIATVAILLLILMMPSIYFYKIDMDENNQTSCSIPLYLELYWALIYSKVNYVVLRIFLPFFIMITSSILIVWKMRKMKSKLFRHPNHQREIQLAKSLVAMDIFFIVFRLPMLVWVFLNSNIFSILHSIVLFIGNLYVVFIFVVLILFNRVYHDLFFKYICYKYYHQSNFSKLTVSTLKITRTYNVGNTTKF
jgi:hypothetical protein